MTVRRTRGQSWRKALLPAAATVQDAIRCLNESALQIALVVSADGTFVGTITDGDIRRGLLRGLQLTSAIDSIIFHDALVVPPELTHEAVLGLMQANEIFALPVIGEGRKVVGLHVLHELLAPADRPNIMVIMAGGQGVRLMPQTENCPKPLLPVDGKPMLEWIIERARREGFSHFVLAIHYLGQMIEDYFGDGSRWQARIDYLRESVPLGTAGALGLISPRPKAPFIVSNGDVLTDIRYGELLDFHCRHATEATMAVRQHEWQHPFGVVRTKGLEIVGLEEKPVVRDYVNAGIYAIEPSALDHVAVGERCDMTTLFSRLRDDGRRTIVYPVHERWIDLGLPDDLQRAQLDGGSKIAVPPFTKKGNQ